MRYLVSFVLFPVAAAAAVIAIVVVASLFAIHAAFGYDAPVVDE